MKDEQKTSAELLEELTALRQRVAELEEREIQHQLTHKALQESIASERSLEEEIEQLLATDQATRIDMAVALQKLQQEVRERQQVETALRESEERLRLALNVAQLGCWDWDILTNKVTWSKNYERLFGLSLPGTLWETYQAFLERVHPEDQDTISQALQHALKNTAEFNSEFRIIWVDGQIHWISAKGHFFENESGQVVRMIGVCMDITERKRVEEILRQQAADLRNQHAWLEGVLNRMPTPLLFIEPGTAKVTFANKAADELAGGTFPKDKPAEEYHTIYYCTDTSGTRIPDEQMPGVRVARGERLHGFEMNWHTSQGIRSLLIFGDTLPAMHGHPATCVVVFQDIRERKRLDEALRVSEERFRMLLESVKDYAIMFLDIEGQIVKWSAGAASILGYEEAEILGKSSSCLFTPEDIERGEDEKELNMAVTEDRAENERWHVRKDGTRFWGSGIVTALRDQSRQLQGFSKIMRDLTEQKQAEEQHAQLLAREQEARTQAEAANRMKDDFLATLSHELRSPLNAMLGWTSLLRTRKFDAVTTARAIETIERNARAQAQLIEDLLDVSRIIRGQLRLNIRRMELVAVIESAVDTVRPAADAKMIQLQLRLDTSVSRISGDPDRLQQVVWNLLTNAIKFTPQGGQVQVSLQRIDSHIRISVSDTGEGISPDFLPYVFDRFRQADSSITRPYSGLGLGLAIVRHLVELHGGTVDVQSLGKGQGATFTVQLPLMAVWTEVKEPQSSQSTVSTPVPFSCPLGLQGVRILIVDDEVDARELLKSILEECGAEVTATTSAEAALALVQQLKPDILISDIGMPQEDGYSLIRRVRALEIAQEGRMPAVALTAYARAEDRKAALLAGFQSHVTKPVEPAELLAVIAALVGRTGS